MSECDRQRHLDCLRTMAVDHRQAALRHENTGTGPDSLNDWERHTQKARTIEWALRELEPMTEGPRQILAAIGSAAE